MTIVIKLKCSKCGMTAQAALPRGSNHLFALMHPSILEAVVDHCNVNAPTARPASPRGTKQRPKPHPTPKAQPRQRGQATGRSVS